MSNTISFCAQPVTDGDAVYLIVPKGADAYWEGYCDAFGELSLSGETSFYVETALSGCVDGEPEGSMVGRFSGPAMVLRTKNRGSAGAMDARYVRDRLASGLFGCVVAAYVNGEWV